MTVRDAHPADDRHDYRAGSSRDDNNRKRPRDDYNDSSSRDSHYKRQRLDDSGEKYSTSYRAPSRDSSRGPPSRGDRGRGRGAPRGRGGSRGGGRGGSMRGSGRGGTRGGDRGRGGGRGRGGRGGGRGGHGLQAQFERFLTKRKMDKPNQAQIEFVVDAPSFQIKRSQLNQKSYTFMTEKLVVNAAIANPIKRLKAFHENNKEIRWEELSVVIGLPIIHPKEEVNDAQPLPREAIVHPNPEHMTYRFNTRINATTIFAFTQSIEQKGGFVKQNEDFGELYKKEYSVTFQFKALKNYHRVKLHTSVREDGTLSTRSDRELYTKDRVIQPMDILRNTSKDSMSFRCNFSFKNYLDEEITPEEKEDIKAYLADLIVRMGRAGDDPRFPFHEARERVNKHETLRDSLETVRFQISETWYQPKQAIVLYITQVQQDSQQKHYEIEMMFPFIYKSETPWEDLAEKLQWMVDSGICAQYVKK